MTDTTETRPVTLALDYGRGRDLDADRPCPLCGEIFCLERGTFNMAVKGGPIVCDDCAEKHSPPGTWDAAESLLRGLEDLDNALFYAPPRLRPGLLANAFEVLKWLARHYVAADADDSAPPRRP